MNLRTIKFWAIYAPGSRMVLHLYRFKHQAAAKLEGMPTLKEDCVLVEMKGNYVRPSSTRTKP